MPKTNKSIDSVVEFWENEILQISDGIDNPNGLQWWLVGSLFIMWVVCGLRLIYILLFVNTNSFI